jgi:hypothetical protein
MSNNYQYNPGIGASAQYIASGRPWIKNVSVTAGSTETFTLPAVSRTITIVSNRDVSLYFHVGAPAANKVLLLSASTPHTFSLKCREFYIDNDTVNPASVQVIAGLTGILESYALSGSGITGP